jgi:ribonuclease HI
LWPRIIVVELAPWTLSFDGSSCGKGCGIGIVLISPRGASFEFSLPISCTSTNNQAEYKAVLKGIKLLRDIKADSVEVFGDSMLVVNQLIRKYDCIDDILRVYHEECLELLREFKMVSGLRITLLVIGQYEMFRLWSYRVRIQGKRSSTI